MHLCPVHFADPFGLVVVMARATPAQEDDLHVALQWDEYPPPHYELKVSSLGRLNGRVVVIDYGLPDEQMVAERREYYEGFRQPA